MKRLLLLLTLASCASTKTTDAPYPAAEPCQQVCDDVGCVCVEVGKENGPTTP